MYSSPLTQCFNDLVGALMLDSEFQQKFMQNRVEAINWYNSDFAPRYQQRRLEISAEQLKVIAAVRAKTLAEFIEYAVQLTEARQSEIRSPTPRSSLPRWLPRPGD